MSLGRGIAALLGLAAGLAAALIDHRRGHADRDEARGHALVRS
jgi:hypothetical protein